MWGLTPAAWAPRTRSTLDAELRMSIAIVTGASSGLGVHFAQQLARRDEVDAVWLVARRRDRLVAVAESLEGATGRVIVADLSTTAGVRVLSSAIDTSTAPITWLVNNAGFGHVGPFADMARDRVSAMVDVNIGALTTITHAAIPRMAAGSRIVQVASSAGFGPMPTFAVYAASKAYVLHLSEALAAELEPSGITCTAVCPGPVNTEFAAVAAGEPTDALAPRSSAADPADVVELAIRDAERGKLRSVYGLPVKAWGVVSNLVPRRMALSAAAAYKRRSRPPAADDES